MAYTSLTHMWTMYSLLVDLLRTTYIKCCSASMTTKLSSTQHSVNLVLVSWNFWGTRWIGRAFVLWRRSKLQVVRNFPCPMTCCKRREFLGLVNFYHCFIPHCAAILQPLHSLLSSKQGEYHALHWTTEADIAFSATKKALANASLLFHPKPNAPISIMTDASDMAVGAVLQQQLDGILLPIFQRSLNQQRHVTAPLTRNSWQST